MKELPLTVKRSIELMGLGLCVALLAIASNIIMPIIMAFLISILLLPVYRFLRKYKIPESIAIIIPILLLFIFLAGIIWFFSAQVGILINDFPEIKANVAKHLQSLQVWVSSFTNFSIAKQEQFINEKTLCLF